MRLKTRFASQPSLRNATVALALLVFGAAPAAPEVVDSNAGGFTVRVSVNVRGTPAEAYSAFVDKVAKWWNPAHTFSHDAANLSLQARPAGCFCEQLPGGGGVRHMEVAYVAPGKTILLHGGIGPMLSQAVTGAMEINFIPADQGTKVTLTYAVGGYIAGGVDKWAAPSNAMLFDQIARFKSFVESGDSAKPR
jgi:hypothetical protein